MHIALAPLLFATALGLAATAQAADPATPTTQPGGMAAPGKMGGGMMAGRMMDKGAMHCMGLSDEGLASAKADLNLTSKQLPSWNAFVETVKDNRQLMGPGMMRGQGSSSGEQPGAGMMMASGSLPERLERHERMMSAHLEALRKTRVAVTRLYGDLTPDQRSKADRLLCGQVTSSGEPAATDAPADHVH
jgi:hypothetical protein